MRDDLPHSQSGFPVLSEGAVITISRSGCCWRFCALDLRGGLQ
jgi:hypothetical protein